MKKILTFLCLLCLSSGCTNSINSQFILTFIPLAKGDCFLLITNDYHYLIDTGRSKDYSHIEAVLTTKNITELDGIILTHGHKDHAGSLEQLLDNFTVHSVYVSSQDNQSYDDIDARSITSNHNVTLVDVNQNDQLILDDTSVKFWIPNNPDYEEENNNSIITTITHGNKRFVMMGDAQKDEEKQFLKSNNYHNIDVLKLGHHGEDDASSDLFLSQLNPKYAIITASDEKNPDSFNNRVSDYLSHHNCQIFDANNQDLCIDFISNGNEITVEISH